MATVLIAGAGPTGLMLASELRTAGVDVVLVDRLAERSGESRAGGMHPRTMEVLDQRGILDRFLAEGRPLQVGHYSGLALDFSDFPTRYPYTLVLLQYRVERLLEQRAAELGVTVRWSTEVIGIDQHDDGVEVTVRTPAGIDTLTVDYVVGCDGGRSAVRKLAGIDFPGTDATLTSILGDVELASPPEDLGSMQRYEHGGLLVFDFEPGWYRVVTTEYDRVLDRDTTVDVEELRRSLIRIAGTDFGMHSPRWISHFGDAARQADRYRAGRVLLAGDAAHIHFPAGGQGQNLGIQDAVNLGWKLAAVATGHAPDTLLDTYESERHPVAARVLHNTRAQTALGRPGPHTEALRETVETLVGFDDVNRYLAGMINALDLHYPLGDAHALLGRRMPDLDLKTADGDTRTFTLLHNARPVLLNLGHPADLPALTAGWSDRLDLITARTEDIHPRLPDIGPIELPTALLIRPDGYIAWAATESDNTPALLDALTTWLGPSSDSRTTDSTKPGH
ncbi:FAD-dependent monooxygenase [Nocardia sp. NPDC051570]|uniref:FAD-dependent monooxygenase n=1 Tax=Nocardia sp. NPDC051570 TaxID=3364324 RepID=UPI00378D203F